MIAVTAEQFEGGVWFASARACPGCWGEGQTKDEALDDFCTVLREWYEVKGEEGDTDMPTLQVTTTNTTREGES